MKIRSKAFTLIEILLVSSLTVVLGVAIFRSFTNGLKLWTKAERINREAEVAIFLDKMAEDLRSSTVISGITFKGTQTKVSFPAIIMTKADPKSARASEGVVDQIGTVQYRFEAGQRTIFRRQANYGLALKGKWEFDEVPIVLGINELSFHYEMTADKGFLLKSEINGVSPLGVMVDVHFSDDNGEHQLKRYLSIPVGG